MSSPYVGEIRLFGFNYAPRDWALCQGQSISVAQNQALFAVIGNLFGGNTTAFNLPDFRGRAPVGFGTGVSGIGTALSAIAAGAKGGAATHVLTTAEIPAHNHQAIATTATADRTSVAGNRWAASAQNPYSSSGGSVPLSSAAAAPTGSSAAHPNEQPYLVLNFCIALSGLYPSRP